MNQTKKHTTGKKLLALLLALIMSVSLLPMSVFAADLDVPETELQVTEPVEEDMQEPEVTDVEGEGDADVQNMEGGAAVYADAAQINYVEKTKSVPLKDGTFYRIVHIDCGRKYFSFTDLKKIIDYAAASNYTHVELAFGNDGLRFLLDDMEVTASGVTYASEAVKSAIQAGNKAFYDAGTNELTQTQMNDIISYANGKGIGIIPMFDAPGHLQTVVRAMATLGVATNKYTTPTTSGTSVNYAIDFTDAASVNFVQALMQKYITYFKGQGCTMFNIAADECGLKDATYTAYAKMVNSMAAMVQNAGMTALAFNDGFYHKGLNTTVDFDTNIAICYWDASSDKYAPAATLADKGFKIINTHNKWYYVIGVSDTGWYGATWSKNNMEGNGAPDCIANKCDVTDGGYQTETGCMNAIWCDTPSEDADMATIEDHIKTLANVEYNTAYFTPVTPQPVVSIVDSTGVAVSAMKVGDTTTLTLSSGDEASWSVDKADVIELSTATRAATATGATVTAKALKAGTATVTATVGNDTYTTTITVQDAGDVEVTENRTITVTVGGTATDVIDGDYNGNYPTDRTDIAIVEKTEVKNIPASTGDPTKVTTLEDGRKYIIGDGNGNYLMRNGSSLTNTKSADKAKEWTITKNTSNNSWIISDSGYYLSYYSSGWTLNLRKDTNQYVSWGYDGTGFRYYDNSNYRLKYRNSNWQITGDSGGANGAAYEKGTPTPGGNQTTITFKGVAVGTTHVTIGNVKYTINVIAEDLTDVSPLPIQLWITNNTIEASGTNAKKTGSGWGGDSSLGGQAGYISLPAATKDTASAVYSENGMYLVDAFAAAGMTEPLVRYEWGGTRFITARDSKPSQNLVFWTGRIHNSSDSNIQTVWGGDYSNSGVAFNYVRYWNKVWQVSADRDTWTTVTGSGSTGTKDSCIQQLAAYYMTRTEITKEVTTDVADWGKPNGGTEYTSQVGSDFVLLDYAVKYADGSRVPNKFPVTNKTLAYHCESNNAAVGTDSSGNKYRMLNNFRGVETENFEVYMVTVTMTSASAQTTVSTSEAENGYTYDDTTEQIVWAIDETAREKSGLDDYTSISGSPTYSGCKIGGTMDIRGVEIYNKHGALITYYVRAKAAVEDKLIVNYYVEGEKTPFYFYEIGVESGTTFDHRFARTENPVGLQYNTVLNIINQEETVNWQLETMPEIKSQYRYSEYNFVRTDFTGNEYKIVNLYYTFKTEKTFVVDFGLPLVITPKDINQNLAANGVKITGADIGNVSSYAKITTDNDFNITYTLTKTIDGSDTFSLKYTGTLVKNETTGEVQVGEVKYSITIIPASNVYYEDSFATFNNGAGAAADARWSTDGTEQTANQLLEVLGDKTNLYGYDKAYENCTTFSMGSAHKVTVTADMAASWNDSSAWPTATFTFKGTGFDIISLTDNNSGAIVVKVYEGKDTSGKLVKSYIVNNYYGYKYNDATKTWEVSNESGANALYQIPVMKITDLTYGEYTAIIKVSYGAAFDFTNSNSYSFWLDAIRVYDPMGENADYAQDDEGWPQYIKLRTELKNSTADIKTSVFIDGKEEAGLEDYTNYGPNNEVYLLNGQAISFKLPADEQIGSIQIGAKAPQAGEKGAATMAVTNAALNAGMGSIDTATEMYYELNGAKGQTVIIANTGNGILSLTNLKITFNTKPGENVKLQTLSDEDAANAVVAVRALFAAPVEPDPELEVFAPEYFQATWNRGTVKVGQKATLTVKTSADVEAITVDGKTIDTYRTRTERSGWGWNATKVTYHVFTFTVTATEAGTLNYSIVATDADGVNSEAFDAPALTVQAASQRPGIGGWLDSIFGRWF